MTGSAYSDLSRPPLSEKDLSRALVGSGGLWRAIHVRAETGSTNADVAEAARAGEQEGLVIVAESQTAGRGRLDRRWEAPPRSSIMLSALLRPAVPAARWGWLPLLAGVAVAEAVGRVGVVEARLKWPNDLLLRSAVPAGPDDRFGKGAGILAEVVPEAGAVVVGIGLNVSQTNAELPPPRDGGFAPTSLAVVGAASIDRDPLVRAILRALATWYGRFNDAQGIRALVGCGRRTGTSA